MSTEISMKGEGYYDEHSLTQNNLVASTTPFIERALRSLEHGRGGPFYIVDFGCSEGANSVVVACTVIDTILAKQPKRSFVIVHNDLPYNNFNRLFKHIPFDYQMRYPKNRVLAFASGASFFGYVMPNNSVDFAFSSSSVHWLSSMPECTVKNHIYFAGASEQELTAVRKLAATDWRNFLISRADELRPGAKMLLCMGAQLPQPNGFDETISCQNLMELLNQLLLEKVNSGEIDRKAFESFAMPLYMRSEEDLLEPFADKVDGVQGRLQVDEKEITTISCPFYSRFLNDGDAPIYAQSVVGTIRGFAEPCLLQGLFDTSERRRNERVGQPPQQLLDDVFAKMTETIAAQPKKYSFNPITSYLLISRC